MPSASCVYASCIGMLWFRFHVITACRLLWYNHKINHIYFLIIVSALKVYLIILKQNIVWERLHFFFQTMRRHINITAANICRYHMSALHHLKVKFAYDIAPVSMHGYNNSTFLSGDKKLMEKGVWHSTSAICNSYDFCTDLIALLIYAADRRRHYKQFNAMISCHSFISLKACLNYWKFILFLQKILWNRIWKRLKNEEKSLDKGIYNQWRTTMQWDDSIKPAFFLNGPMVQLMNCINLLLLYV